MKRLELLFLCKKATAVYLQRGISTDPVLLARTRKVRVTAGIPYEPGIRHRQEVFQKDSDITEDVEDEADIDNEINAMNLEEAYDINMREKKRDKNKIQRMITAKKFFSPSPLPSMLTINERLCIRYLHKEDPVQWDIKTLSESFPATPDAIKKVLKANWKFTPERAKMVDTRVQKNWELLAEGKLKAEPRILEHLKKFINRRHVLLEQIKNDKFYLPEIKKEPVWNKGEFTNVLVKYEKAVQRLAKQTEKSKMLESGISEVKYKEEEQRSALDVVHEKVKKAASRNKLENKDSFLYGGLTKFYSKERTLEELEDDVLKRADKKKSLSVLDEAILENKLGMKYERKSENLTHSESLTLEKTKGSSQWRSGSYDERDMREDESFTPEKRGWQSRGRRYDENDMREGESFTPEEQGWQSRGRRYDDDMREGESFTPEKRGWQSRGRRYDGDMSEAESFTPEKRGWQSRSRRYDENDMREGESFTPEKRGWQSRDRRYDERDMTEGESFTPEKRGWQSRGRRYDGDMSEAESFTPEKRGWQSRSRRYDEGDMREAESFTPEKRGWQSRGRRYDEGDMREAESFTPEKRGWQSRDRRYGESDMRDEMIRIMNMKSDNFETDEDDHFDSTPYPYPDDRTLFADETGIGKLLNDLKKKQEPQEPKPEAEKKEDKPKIDFSDPERVKRENIYYDAEVDHIKDTSFWNNNRSSKEKAMAELEKLPHRGPHDEDPCVPQVKTSILSNDPYPRRIQIPRNKRGSGLTFKVKDCYYDDDGQFLYRVPGMMN